MLYWILWPHTSSDRCNAIKAYLFLHSRPLPKLWCPHTAQIVIKTAMFKMYRHNSYTHDMVIKPASVNMNKICLCVSCSSWITFITVSVVYYNIITCTGWLWSVSAHPVEIIWYNWFLPTTDCSFVDCSSLCNHARENSPLCSCSRSCINSAKSPVLLWTGVSIGLLLPPGATTG